MNTGLALPPWEDRDRRHEGKHVVIDVSPLYFDKFILLMAFLFGGRSVF